MIYLDNAATTPLAPEVLDAMLPYLKEQYGNPGSLYQLGRTAHDAVERARQQVADLFNCDPEHIIFTSGGSESNSMVFHGLKQKLLESGKTHLVVSAIEHNSVLKAAEALTKEGFDITYVMPDTDGRITARSVEEALRDDTGLVSVMFINNETGVINYAYEIGMLCKARGILFHSDCVQAVGSVNLDMELFLCDFVSMSAHKIHGPKGVGALYIRDEPLEPLIRGGAHQEFGLRGGTENVAGVVGFGKACEIVSSGRGMPGINECRCKFAFLEALNIDDAYRVNGAGVKTINLCIPGVFGESLVLMLDSLGVCISAGSACNSHEAKPSHVLLACGLSPEDARCSVRISFSKYTTEDEAREAATLMSDCVKILRTQAVGDTYGD